MNRRSEPLPDAKAGVSRPSSSVGTPEGEEGDSPAVGRVGPRTPSFGEAYGERVAERLRASQSGGRLPAPDAVGVGGSRECGSLVTLQLRIEAGVIADARYQAYGCPATLASADTVCESVKGRTLLEAAQVGEEGVRDALGLRPEKAYTAGVAVDALQAALGAFLSRCVSSDEFALEKLGSVPPDRHGVLVGMSGGVDSGFAASLLKQAGFRVAGITLRLWTEEGPVGARSCCSLEAVHRARVTAHSLGLPHLTLDATTAFRERVVDYFVNEYRTGRTPNPCVKCNSRLRLDLMLRVARLLGWERIATGHYARLTGARHCLTRGADLRKDQSYVLAEVSPELLQRVIFPLGEMTKDQVRASAAEAGLPYHSAPESQEICFVPNDDHRRFLRQRLGERPGEIVDRGGKVLGRHSGIYNFTVGQRRGVRVAGGQPLYVVALDGRLQRVIVGERTDTAVGAVRLESIVLHHPDEEGDLTVQLRSTGPALPVSSLTVEEQEVHIVLEQPAYGVAPGQTGVVYRGSQVALAGTINATAPRTS